MHHHHCRHCWRGERPQIRRSDIIIILIPVIIGGAVALVGGGGTLSAVIVALVGGGGTLSAIIVTRVLIVEGFLTHCQRLWTPPALGYPS